MAKRVRRLEKNGADHARWDEYVKNHENGTFFHLSGWKTVISEAYRHSPHYLYLEKDDVIVGVLPLFEQKSLVFGHTLISTPFCVYGGAIAEDEDGLLLLEQAAAVLGKQLKVDYIELRYATPRGNNPDLTLNCHHSTYLMPIAESEQEILQSIKKKQRANVRQSLKNNLVVEKTSDVDSVHRIYSESVRNLGTPVFPKKFFALLISTFGEDVDLMSVKKDGVSVSAVLSFYYKDTVLPYYGGGTPDARQLKSNDFMYYSLMCRAKREKNASVFDFGRSKNESGSGNYKKTWGITPQPLYYYCQLVEADSLPNLSPDNPKYKYFIQLWKKLPLFITERLGPYLSKYLG